MLFGYMDDGSLDVVADENEAKAKFDPDNVESGVVRIFDANGKPLAATFSKPGAYSLAPDKTAGAETLQQAFGPILALMANKYFKDIDAVYAHLGMTPQPGRRA